MRHALERLLEDGIIDEVLGQLRSGKEAEIWRVVTEGREVAAKVYKERHVRSFRNDSGYREGRKVRDSRTRRAMAKGTRFGQAASEQAWKSAEADALHTLHAEGVRVPKPVLFYEGVLLMELVRDTAGRPAPRLVDAPPQSPLGARDLWVDLRAQVVRMLSVDLIHGDLSPYNVLMGGSGATVIDFPQTLAGARNNRSEFYFRRDLENLRRFLEGFDRSLREARADAAEIWDAYVRRELTADFVPSGTRAAPRSSGARPGATRRANPGGTSPVPAAKRAPNARAPVSEPGNASRTGGRRRRRRRGRHRAPSAGASTGTRREGPE